MCEPEQKRLCDLVKPRTDRSIILNNYLDVLMNVNVNPFREGEPRDEKDTTYTEWNKLTKYKQYNYRKSDSKVVATPKDLDYWGGIVLPQKPSADTSNPSSENNPGSGNIVIIGEPGVGKTTLAFQMAVSCASKPNDGIAVYYSLSTPRTQLINCMVDGGTENKKGILLNRPSVISSESDINDDDDALLKHLKNLLRCAGKGADTAQIKPQILFPSLTPKGLSGEMSHNAKEFFRRRLSEIEMMLRTIKKYNHDDEVEKEKYPRIKMVVLDSLNDFNIEPLNKIEVSKLFEVFEHYGVLGVFTLAENKRGNSEELIIDDAVRYDADTVLHLQRVQHKDYLCSLISVAKSRYVRAVMGEHVYKIQDGNTDNETYGCMKKHLEVLPSLHHVIIGSAPDKLLQCGRQTSGRNIFGIEELNDILPSALLSSKNAGSQIINLKGDSGLFKSDLAVNALLWGMSRPDDEERNGMVIHLSERNLLKNGNVRLEESVLKAIHENRGNGYFKEIPNPPYIANNPNKRDVYCWEWNRHKLFEVVFRSGALLPEEFMEEVLSIVRREKIRTIAFTDIKHIGTSYPFLVDNRTSGELFLSAFIHIMRNEGVDLITTSSTTGFEPSDREMNKIAIMSDAAIDFTMKKVKKYEGNPVVIMRGEGSVINNKICTICIVDEDSECGKELDEKLLHINENSHLRLMGKPLFRIESRDAKPSKAEEEERYQSTET